MNKKPENKALVMSVMGPLPKDSLQVAEETGLKVNQVKSVFDRVVAEGALRRVKGGYILANKSFQNYWLSQPWRISA